MNTSTDEIRRAVEVFSIKYKLTKRETEILNQLVLKNVTAEGIANTLSISKNTVRIHFQNIFSKMGLTSKSELLGIFIDFLMNGEEIKGNSSLNQIFKIMIAEDDEDFKKLTVKALNKLRGNSIEVTDTADGMDMIRMLEEAEELPDLILLSTKLPVLDGFSVLKCIKNRKNFEHIPVIMFSSTNNQDDIKKAYSLGGNSYLMKPSGFKSLVKVLDVVVNYWEHTSSPV